MWDGRMDLFTAGGRVMGDVVVSPTEHQEVTFVVDGLQPGWEARLVHNGRVFESVPVDGAELKVTREIETAAASVVRFCVHNQEGEAVVCSNPLYFYPQPPQRLLPPVRLKGHGPA
jgi:hypothetical protein